MFIVALQTLFEFVSTVSTNDRRLLKDVMEQGIRGKNRGHVL